MAELKCKKCIHFYRVMATGEGYNPYPCCRYYEDTGKWPNVITQECFECRKRTRKEAKQNDKTRV